MILPAFPYEIRFRLKRRRLFWWQWMGWAWVAKASRDVHAKAAKR